jgi:hypothetical protein
MRLVEQWREIESRLPEGSSEARIALAVDGPDANRAASLLGPLNPGRGPGAIRFVVRRGGGPASPESVGRLLQRLDRQRIGGHLELQGTTTAAAAQPEVVYPTLVEAWERELATLPADWSDLLAEVEFRSSDQLDRAALLMSPLNPVRPPGETDAYALRFRCAQRFGYGASPQMVRRCVERCDAERIRGTARILRALSDTHPVATQGPVWYVGGRTT